MPDPVVAAVVVSYGPAARARDCVLSLLAGARKPDCVLVIHNGPQPFDTELAGAAHFDLRSEQRPAPAAPLVVVEVGTNLGYAGALALGVELLGETTPLVDYLWLLNNDAVVHARALAELLTAASQDPGVGLWGCTICSDPSFATVAATGVAYSRWTTRRRPLHAGAPTDAAMTSPSSLRLDFVPGSALFMPRSAYERCGGLSTTYFLYFEELDLVARLRRRGFRIGWCRKALVAHAGGASTGSYRRRRARPASVAYHSTRSAIIYTRRHHRVALASVIVTRLAVHVCGNLLIGHVSAAAAALRGCLAGFSRAVGEIHGADS